MELYIHYTALPQGMELGDVVEELNRVLDDHGVVCGGEDNRLDLELEDEKVNPKYAQLAVKRCLQSIQFPHDTVVEIGGMEIGLYE